MVLYEKRYILKIETQYNYEKTWTLTQEKDLLKIIEDEIGNADVEGTLLYLKEALVPGKIISIGSCRFRLQESKV